MPGVNAEENGGSEGMMVTNGRNGGGAGEGQQQQAPRKSKVRCRKAHVQVASPKNHPDHLDKQKVQVSSQYKGWVGPKVRKSGRKPLKGRIWRQVDATVRLQNLRQLTTLIG